MHPSHLSYLAILAPALLYASPLLFQENSSPLISRDNGGNIGSYANYFPDCSVDPSESTGTSKYKDGDGLYVTSSCGNGLTTPAVNRFNCWTDLFVVSRQAHYDGWIHSGDAIDCGTTKNCAEYHTQLKQSCTTDTTTWDDKIGAEIQAQFSLWFGKDNSVSPKLSYQHSFGGSKAVQICTTAGDIGTCTWSDQNCHALWVAQRNIQINGYLRRSCNTPREGTNVPNSARRSDGYYTVGMQDISFQVPANHIIGCAAKCGDTQYPDPQPGSDPVEIITPP